MSSNVGASSKPGAIHSHAGHRVDGSFQFSNLLLSEVSSVADVTIYWRFLKLHFKSITFINLITHNERMHFTNFSEKKFFCSSLRKTVRHLFREAMRAGFILSGVTNGSGPIAVFAVGLHGAWG